MVTDEFSVRIPAAVPPELPVAVAITWFIVGEEDWVLYTPRCWPPLLHVDARAVTYVIVGEDPAFMSAWSTALSQAVAVTNIIHGAEEPAFDTQDLVPTPPPPAAEAVTYVMIGDAPSFSIATRSPLALPETDAMAVMLASRGDTLELSMATPPR